jgi:hypothetical protein
VADKSGTVIQHASAWAVQYAPNVARLARNEGVSMTKVSEFHTTGIEDVDELVYHTQSDCPIGQEVKKKGTSAPGQGYFRTLCVKCKSIEDGWEANRPL